MTSHGQKVKADVKEMEAAAVLCPVCPSVLLPLAARAARSQGKRSCFLALHWVLSVLIAQQAAISLKGAVGVSQGGKSWVFGTSFIFHNLIWPDVGMQPQLRTFGEEVIQN